jgi:DNA segregation ATPase FtsK/SpoIIIE-like protein
MPNIQVALKKWWMRTGQRSITGRSQAIDNQSVTLEGTSFGLDNLARKDQGDSTSINNPVPDIPNDDLEKIRIHVPKRVGRLRRWLTRTKQFWKPSPTAMELDAIETKRRTQKMARSLDINKRNANKLIPAAYARIGIEYQRIRTKDRYENEKPQRVHFVKWLHSADGNTIYGKVDRVPYNHYETELVDERALTSVSIALGHPVGGRIDPNGGGVIISVALAGTMDIDDMFAFNKALELISPSAPPLTFMVGATANGGRKTYNLEEMPHLLIAGSTGSGKSVAMLGIIGTFAARNTPEMVQLLLADFKGVDFNHYEGLPHLIKDIPEIPSGIVDKDSQIVPMLTWVEKENKRRQGLFSKALVHNLSEWNRHNRSKKLHRIVIFIDEIARLNQYTKTKEEFTQVIYDLASTARATGIHLVLSTQFPKDEYITTAVKMNIPGRMAFSVPDVHGSICMIETGEAVNIFPPPGRGIFVHGVNRFKFQSPFITDSQIQEIIRNAKEGKTTAAMARSTELSPDELVRWALTENNGFLGQREAFREFPDRLPWNELIKMLIEMDKKVFTFGDAQYKVIPPAGQRMRQLERLAGEIQPAKAPEPEPALTSEPLPAPEPEPAPTPEPLSAPEPVTWAGGPCPECGAPRKEIPCEFCGNR